MTPAAVAAGRQLLALDVDGTLSTSEGVVRRVDARRCTPLTVPGGTAPS